MRTAKYEVWQATNGKWFFHLRATNGECVGPSEGYATKRGALRGVESHRRNAATAVVVVV